jgi:hypothetical protein
VEVGSLTVMGERRSRGLVCQSHVRGDMKGWSVRYDGRGGTWGNWSVNRWGGGGAGRQAGMSSFIEKMKRGSGRGTPILFGDDLHMNCMVCPVGGGGGGVC